MRGYRLEVTRTCIWAVAGTIRLSLHAHSGLGIELELGSGLRSGSALGLGSGWSQGGVRFDQLRGFIRGMEG